MKRGFIILGIATVILIPGRNVFAHCEVPCGIYDDKARVKLIHEHIGTIEKSMAQIKALSAVGDKNYNQLIRWTNNKEEHASKIQEIVFQYFMTQRIKPKDPADADAYNKYVKELTLLHSMLVSAMKSKQTLDTAHPMALHNAVEQFSQSYFGSEMEGSPDKGSKGSPMGSPKGSPKGSR